MEFALNVLHRLVSVDELHDHEELLARRLLERTRRGGDEWLRVLAGEHRLIQEPIVAPGGRALAEPLFWFERAGRKHAVFFPDPPAPEAVETLRLHGVETCALGGTFD